MHILVDRAAKSLSHHWLRLAREDKRLALMIPGYLGLVSVHHLELDLAPTTQPTLPTLYNGSHVHLSLHVVYTRIPILSGQIISHTLSLCPNRCCYRTPHRPLPTSLLPALHLNLQPSNLLQLCGVTSHSQGVALLQTISDLGEFVRTSCFSGILLHHSFRKNIADNCFPRPICLMC